jgi:hypothetical protein
MEQHPVPQNIASFQFKLIGSLTFRQFVTLAIPLTLATLIFFSSVGSILRISLAVVIGGFGLFAALVPVGGRPFDKWFLAFIRAIFSPTQRIWIKEKHIPEFLNVVIRPAQDENKIPEEITLQGRERMLAFLRSLPRENASSLDIREQVAIQELNLTVGEAGEGKLPPPIIWPTKNRLEQKVEIMVGEDKPKKAPKTGLIGDIIEPGQMPFIGGLVKQLEKVAEEKKETVTKQYMVKPKISENSKAYILSGIEDRLRHKAKEDQIRKQAATHLASEANFSLDNIISLKEPNNKVRLMRGIGKTRVRKLHFAPPENFDLSKLPIRGERRFEISDELARRFHFEEEDPEVILPNSAKSTTSSVQINIPIKGQEVGQTLPKQTKQVVIKKVADASSVPSTAKREVKKEETSRFSMSNTKQIRDIPNLGQSAQIIPLTSSPNVVSGLVTDMSGMPIDGAVLVIRDTNGLPVRALKTNKLGQFLSATPLSNGVYTIEVESERVKFKPTQLSASGQVLQPLGIQGEVLK